MLLNIADTCVFGKQLCFTFLCHHCGRPYC